MMVKLLTVCDNELVLEIDGTRSAFVGFSNGKADLVDEHGEGSQLSISEFGRLLALSED